MSNSFQELAKDKLGYRPKPNAGGRPLLVMHADTPLNEETIEEIRAISKSRSPSPTLGIIGKDRDSTKNAADNARKILKENNILEVFPIRGTTEDKFLSKNETTMRVMSRAIIQTSPEMNALCSSLRHPSPKSRDQKQIPEIEIENTQRERTL